MKRLTVFLISIFTLVTFPCFSVQAVDDRRLPSLEVLKTWESVFIEEKRVTAQTAAEESKYGKYYKIQRRSLVSPPSDGDHRRSVSITLTQGLDGNTYASARKCYYFWDDKSESCSFKPEAIVVWETSTLVAK